MEQPNPNPSSSTRVYWRVEGSLADLTTVRPVAFFTWNAQTFLERWVRRGMVLLMAVLRPFLYAANRIFATRMVHTVLRGISRDRLDLLGEEYFKYKLQPYLKNDGMELLKSRIEAGDEIVLVSQGLEHVMRPLAQHLGVKWLIANRLEFRDGIATGRLAGTGGAAAWTFRRHQRLRARMAGAPRSEWCAIWVCRAWKRWRPPWFRLPGNFPSSNRPIVYFDGVRHPGPLSVRRALAGKHVMLIGVTGFIGKVWLANTLMELPEIGRIYLLIRRQKSNPAARRFEKLVEESPVFDPLYARYGAELSAFLRERVEVIEGDVCQPGLGLAPEVSQSLQKNLDLIINSSGLTDFNPDLRDALATNVDAAVNVTEFVRQSDHAGLLHLSTCYVAGARDGRVGESMRPDYTPAGVHDFDAEVEWRSLHAFVKQAEQLAESPAVTEELRQQALSKEHAAKDLHGRGAGQSDPKKSLSLAARVFDRSRHEARRRTGMAQHLHFDQESGGVADREIRRRFADRRGASRDRGNFGRQSRSSGWNEGINTSASLSYLLGTSFRQLPTNEKKRLDIIPVDSVCRGMTLIGAAIVERRHDPLYQLATSVTNPCDMRRSIELTSLAHRKHYRAQEGLEYWLRLRLDAIPVSKERYNRMSAPAQKAIVKSIQRIMSPLPLKKTPLVRAERNLERVEKLIKLFEPFILHNEQDFAADNVERLSYALAEEEKAAFGYDTRSIDWWDYWINIHIPALRKWTYPLIEGRPLEARPARSLQQPAAVPENGEVVKTGTNGATWRYS